MTEHVPHVLGGVRCIQREQDSDGLGSLADGRVSRAGAGVDGLASSVDKLHGLRDDHVELAALNQALHLVHGARNQLLQLQVAGGCIHTGFAGDVLSHAPGASQELLRAGGRNVGPVHVILGRGSENHGGADCIHTELIELFTQVHAVTQRLGHSLTAVEHLTLVHEGLEGLIMLNQTQVANNLGEETCVQQVQNCVLHTANVHVDGTPLAHGLRVERSLIEVRGNVAQKVPGGVHEGVHGVRVTASLLATLRAGHDSPVISGGQGRLALRSQLLATQVIG